MAHATFADLPPEMVRNVFAFVRSKPHQGAICLVSRTWRSIAAPLLWEKIKTDLSAASSRALATLVHPDSGIVGHIRELEFLDTFNLGAVEDRARVVIAAIPTDRLRNFTCYHSLNTCTLQILLQSQRKIGNLWVRTPYTTPGRPGPSDLDSEVHYAWMTSSLPVIKSIVLHIDQHNLSEESILKGITSISDSHSKIDDLMLASMTPTRNQMTSLCGILRHDKDLPLFSNLSSLRLMDLKLGKPGDQSSLKTLDLSKLSCLQMEGCNYIVPFVDSLSSYYTRDIGRLKELYILLPYQLEEPKDSVKAIGKLLKVCSKLEALQLQMSRHGCVAKDCILAHRQKLDWLMVGTGASESPDYFSVTEMTAILRACVHLEHLAINMPAVNLGSITKLGTGFHPEGGFAELLAIVSEHPALNAFRILNLPTVEFHDSDSDEIVPANRHVYFCQTLMQNFANQIFQFMADRGSKLRILSIKPSIEDTPVEEDELDVDANGHKWPEYNYTRGRFAETTGTNGVIAHPLRKALLNFPCLEALLS